MGVNLVIVIENLNNRTQDDVNQKFGVSKTFGEDFPNWELFKYRGKKYASWLNSPRYFELSEQKEKWEAVRKYIVKAREYFGNGEVMLTNDVITESMPPYEGYDGYDDPDYRFCLGWTLSEKELAEPDYERYPELKNVEELKGLIW